MTPQLVDHAHTDSCAVIGCNLMQLRRKMNMFISGRSHISHCEQRFKCRLIRAYKIYHFAIICSDILKLVNVVNFSL